MESENPRISWHFFILTANQPQWASGGSANSLVAPALTDTETLEEVIDCLAEHISVETQGACDQETLFNILVRAASLGDSIENTAKSLKNVPNGNDIRYHLDKVNNFEELESQLNQALKSRIPPRIKKGHQRLAINLNLIPYYGEPAPEESPYIYRSQAKDGTCSFYAYATLYVIKKGKRVTLAIRGVRWRDTSVAIITYLLAEISSLKLKIQSLYLDRGFFSAAVIRWLQALDIILTANAPNFLYQTIRFFARIKSFINFSIY